MTQQLVALLAGVNVGGRHLVPMAQLRQLVEDLGHSEVRTHINSGNVVLSTAEAPAQVGPQLEQALEQHFGFAVPVMVRTTDQLRRALMANPYGGGDPKRVCIAFVADRIEAGAEDRMAVLATGAERFEVHPGEVFIEFGAGIGRSKLAAGLGRALGVPTTVRNVSTLGKILEVAAR